MTADPRAAIEAVWRIESARLIAGVARVVRDVGLAEEFAQDALVAALEQWPDSGVPSNPGAWLMTIAKRRAVDFLRRQERYDRKLTELGHEQEVADESDFDAVLAEEPIEDDILRLMFTACHPVLSTEGRVALTLRVLGGLRTDEIARAFLVPESTIAQRIVRAKRTLAEAQVPFEVPTGADRAERLASVLEVIYLVFNEGYSATAGDDLMRPALCDEAMRLGRVLAELAPGEPEVHGLVALMETPRVPIGGAHGSVGRTDPAARPGSRPMEHAAHPSWPRRARTRRGTRWGGRAVRPPGGHQRLSCSCPHGGADGLGTDSDAVLRTGGADTFSGDRAESRGGARHGVRAVGGSHDGRRAGRRASAQGLLPVAERTG